MASTPTNDELKAEITTLGRELVLSLSIIADRDKKISELEEKCQQLELKLSKNTPSAVVPSGTIGAGSGPPPESEMNVGPYSLHRAYADLSPTGHWDYWETLPDGTYQWSPQWIEHIKENE